MRSNFAFVFMIAVFGKCLCDGPASFRGDRVIRATPKNRTQLQFLGNLEENNDLDLDFWTHPSHEGGSVDIHVTAEQYPRLAKLLQANGIVFTILIPELQGLLDNENPSSRSGRIGFDYHRYNRLGPIEQELKNLASKYSNLATLVTEFGQPYEGRTIYAIKISSRPGAGKKVFFINCGIHAREWITPATCMYIIKQMLSKYGNDPSVTAMVDKLDWVIMPVFNVDGYEYTHTSYRMWRKTRSPNAGYPSRCAGTDPNRNWNIAWAGPGTSSNPCSDTYHGSRPFSEVEVRNVARYLFKNRRNLIGYMDIHAYSQLWMTPWGYKKADPGDNGEMKRVSDIAVKALYDAGYGTNYKVGPSSIIIYANSGSTKDWAYGFLGVKYAFALELRDQGRYGFALPANQIMPTGFETFAAIKKMAAALQL